MGRPRGAGAVGLLTDRPFGVAFALVAAGARLFLGLMDVTFTVDNGLYRYLGRSWPMRAELVINLWSIGLGRFGPLERAKARLVGEGERARAAAT